MENEDQGAELPLDGVGAQLARARSAERRLARHKALEDEARGLKTLIKATERNRDDLVAQAGSPFVVQGLRRAQHLAAQAGGDLLPVPR